MNKVILMGRIASRNIDFRTTADGSSKFCHFSLAVDRRRTGSDGQREADFIPCTAWNKTCEFIEKYCTTGTKLAVVGRITTNSYEKNGAKVYSTEVTIEEAEFAESKAAADQRAANASQQGYSQPPMQQSYQPSYHQQSPVQPQYQTPPAGYVPGQPQAPAQESQVGQGFMDIPEGIEHEGLPFS